MIFFFFLLDLASEKAYWCFNVKMEMRGVNCQTVVFH